MKRTAIGILAVAVIVTLASPAVVGAADDPVIRATSSGDTVTIALETVPDGGLSGFELSIGTTSDVTIESINIGSNFGLSDSNVGDDGRSASVKGSDGSHGINGGESDVTLATIQLSESVDQPPITITVVTLQSDGSGSQYDATIRVGDGGSSGDGAETTTTPTPTTETTTTDEGGAGPIGGETDLITTDETTTESDRPEETTTTSDTTTTETTTEQSTEAATSEATTTDGGGAPATTGSGPGFGVAIALAALAAIGLFARVRPY